MKEMKRQLFVFLFVFFVQRGIYRDETMIENVKRRWRETPPSRKLLGGIIAVNSAVFLLWQLPFLFPSMRRMFMHNPFSGHTYTLFTS
jgi:protein-S-isoprenylcysteine O-methyltransferase Ste14